MRNPEKYSDDADRISETIFQLDFEGTIKNKDDFNKFYDSYLSEAFELRESKKFRNMVFGKYVEDHPDIISEKESFFERKKLPEENVQRPKIKREFKFIGKVGKRIVFLRKQFVDSPKGKKINYVDRRGNIGKPKNPEI